MQTGGKPEPRGRRVLRRLAGVLPESRKVRALVIVLALAFVGYALWPVNRITFESEGTVIGVITAPKGVELYLDYQHSVIRAPVREAFLVSPSGGFLLIRTEHGAFGAGLPTENFGEFRHDGDSYINSGINRPVPEIPLRVSAGSEQRLTVQDGAEVVFLDFVGANSLVRIRSRTQPRAGYILWRKRFF